MTRILSIIRKDLADPMGSAISAALIASIIALSMIAAIALEQKYLLTHYKSIRQVDAEDDCADPTFEVRRIGEHLYCIGEGE